ncbi:helix-turn-helix domain-containing protein [Clostridium saudiense]
MNSILELKQQGYNQSKIAEKLGITRQAVSKLLKELN